MSLMFDPRANALAAYMMNPLLYDNSSNGGNTAAASAAAAAMSSILQQSGHGAASSAVTNQQLMLRRLPPFNAHQYRQQDGGGQPPTAAMAAIAAATAAAEQQAAVLNLAAHLAAATAAVNSNSDTVEAAHDQQCGEDVNGSKQGAVEHHHSHHDNTTKKLSPSGNNNSFRILDILDHPTTAAIESIRSTDASKMFVDLQKLVNESETIGTLNNNNKTNNNNSHTSANNNGERRRKRRYDEISGENVDDDAEEEEEEDDDDRCGGGSTESSRSCASRTSLNSSLMSQHGGGPGGGNAAAAAAAAAKKARKARTIFTDKQLQELETMFDRHKYLSVQDRMELAQRMGLTDTQVKTWYQNRRTKWKRQAAVGLDLLQETSNLAAVQNLLRTSPYWHQYLAANPFFAQRIFPPPLNAAAGGGNVMAPHPDEHLLSAAFGAGGGMVLPSTTAGSLSLPHVLAQKLQQQQHCVDAGVASTTTDAGGEEAQLFGNGATNKVKEEEKEARCFSAVGVKEESVSEAMDVAEETRTNDDEGNKNVCDAEEPSETLPESDEDCDAAARV